METLELGYELVRRRGRLTALADWLSTDQEQAAAAVRSALAAAWRERAAIESAEELETRLNRLLRARLRGCGQRRTAI